MRGRAHYDRPIKTKIKIQIETHNQQVTFLSEIWLKNSNIHKTYNDLKNITAFSILTIQKYLLKFIKIE